MKAVAIIPARYKSSRFPGKPLANICGKPMVIRVAEIAAAALKKENVFIATDDNRISEVADANGFQTVMTSEKALTGTDRVWEASKKIIADIYVNVQGDEPLVKARDIMKIVEAKKKNYEYVINGMAHLGPGDDINNVNIPKVVVTEDNRMVYMSRLPIPGSKTARQESQAALKQVCIYAFNKEELRLFGELGRKSRLENIEDIEILRFLELGIGVRMIEVEGCLAAVDVPEDINKVEQILKHAE